MRNMFFVPVSIRTAATAVDNDVEYIGLSVFLRRDCTFERVRQFIRIAHPLTFDPVGTRNADMVDLRIVQTDSYVFSGSGGPAFLTGKRPAVRLVSQVVENYDSLR